MIIRERLALYRLGGQPFEMAWERAVHSSSRELWANGPDRTEWISVLEATRAQWQAAYERQPAERKVERLLIFAP